MTADAAERLGRFFEEEWEWGLAEHPESATDFGDARYNDRLTDLSFEAIARRKRHAREALARLERIPAEPLSAEDRLSYDLYRRQLLLEIEGERFPEELLPLTQQHGLHKDFALLSTFTPFRAEKDYGDYLARLSAFPRQVEQTIALMERGRQIGWVLPAAPLAGVPDTIRAQIVAAPEKSPHFYPFERFPEDLPARAGEALRAEARRRIAKEVVPAYARLLDYVERVYLPGARRDVGAWALPDGPAYYAYKIRVETSTGRSAEEIHELGLAEVAGVRRQMEETIRHSGFTGSFAEFVAFLRADPRFYYTDAEGLLRGYRDLCKRIDAELPRLFGRLPRLTYGVVATPDYEAPASTTAYYRPGSPEAGRPGSFTANTYRLDMRPRYEMEALAIHEAVPGHHLQIALAQELAGLPKFRRHGTETAYVEGWALYAESLGAEMGLYADPYSKFGQLTYQMWRAARLVVDTGMHAFRWGRERAISFLEAHTAKTRHDIEVEIDRYIVWPAQALSYKLGELAIRSLRDRAKRALGERFDIRQFHDAVLLSGPLPLDVLEKKIGRWIESEGRT